MLDECGSSAGLRGPSSQKHPFLDIADVISGPRCVETFREARLQENLQEIILKPNPIQCFN